MATLLLRRLSAICALGLLGACALPASPAHRPSRLGADVPLVARIQPTGARSINDLRFYLNRPAHVALFEVVPGRGIGLLYPSRGMGSQFVSGGTHLARTYDSFYRANYLPALQSSVSPQPRYILLVASERPLRIEEMQRSPYGLRGMFGLQQFAAWNPYSTMERLTESVLPQAAGDDWTTDVFVEWPEARQRQLTELVRVQCPSGRYITVPYDRALQAMSVCENGQAKYIPPPPVPSDTSGVRPPRRQRPEPAGTTTPPPVSRRGSEPASGADEPRTPRVARPRPQSSEPRTRDSAPREAPARREPRAEPRPAATPAAPAPRAEPRAAPRVEQPTPRSERPTPRDSR